MNLKQKLLLVGVLLVAIFFRYYQIAQMPGGLFPDEAANGLDVNLMQSGHLQPFYERGNGREALFFYLEWGSVSLFGKGPWQFHIVSALVGVLSVLACFYITRRIFLLEVDDNDEQKKSRAINIALLAVFLMAVSAWHVVLSRTAFRAILIPLFSGLTFYFLLKTYQSILPSPIHGEGSGEGFKNKRSTFIYAALTGAALAAGFYTYIAFRIMAPLLFMVLLWPLLGSIRQRQFAAQIKKWFWPAVWFVLAFVVVFYPIGKYFYQHPGSFVGRAGEVSVFNPSLYTVDGIQLTGRPPLGVVLPVIWQVSKTQLMGFFTHGDLNWRQNISGYPFLSPLYSPFFAFGLLLATWLAIRYFFAPNKKAGYWKYFLLAGWFWAMLLPVVTTAEGIPHGLRGIGAIPPVFIISAWILYEFAQLVMKAHKKLWQHVLYHYKDPQWVKDNHFIPPRMRLVNFGLKLIVVCFVLALIFQTYFLYFVYAANDPANFYYFRSDLTPVSQYLRQRCDKDHTYLVLDKYSVQTTDYLTSDPKGNFSDKCNVPYQQVDPENSWQLTGLMPQDEVIFTQSSVFDTVKFKQYHPDAHLVLEYRNKFNQSIMAVYKVD